MAQADYNVANQSGASFRADLNNQLAAIVSNNSGASEPSTTYAYQWWADTTTGKLKLRNAANSAWIEIVQLDGEWTKIALENGTAAAPPLYFKDSGTDTGFFSPGTDALGFSTGGTERARIDSSGRVGIGSTSPAALLHLKSSSPIIQLEDTDASGAYSQINGNGSGGRLVLSADAGNTGSGSSLEFHVDGSERARIDSSGRVGMGTASPAAKLGVEVGGFDGINIKATTTNQDPILSLTSPSTNYWNMQVDASVGDSLQWRYNNSERLVITSAGLLGIGTSSPSNALTVVDAGGTAGTVDIGPASAQARIYAASDGIRFGSFSNHVVIFRTNNAERCRLDTSGNFRIGTTSGNATPGLFIKGADTSSSSISFQVQNSSSANIIYCKNDTSFHSDGTYNATTTSAANVFISGAAKFGRSTSSIKYKTDVETLQDSYADAILNCRPVWFRSLANLDDPSWGYWGFIAEEVAEIDPRLTFWKTQEIQTDENGESVEVELDQPEPEGVQYDRFVPHLVNLIKRQRDQIEALEARVAALEGA